MRRKKKEMEATEKSSEMDLPEPTRAERESLLLFRGKRQAGGERNMWKSGGQGNKKSGRIGTANNKCQSTEGVRLQCLERKLVGGCTGMEEWRK